MKRLIPLLWCLLLFVACEKEQEPLPSYIEGLVELHADPNGILRTLVTEKGQSYGLLNPQSGGTPNKVYRVYTIYTLSSSGATLYQLDLVPSEPAVKNNIDWVKQYPVELVSLWKTQSRWVNLHMRIPAGEGQNTFDWVWTNIEEKNGAQGAYKKLYLTLSSMVKDTPYLYKKDYFISCPLAPFSDQLQKGVDSICVSVNTNNGRVERTFIY
jgi:hypothetical protein